MSRLLEGKTALISGVANQWSLAWHIAKAFSREGADLILTYQNERLLKSIQPLAEELGAPLLIECDAASDESVAALASRVEQEDRIVHSLIHSIAFANREDLAKPFVETSRDGFLLAQNVSAYTLVALSRAIAPRMTSGGSITTLTYLGATRVVENYNVMGVAKASLEACMRYLASDLGARNIRVNAISAGPVKTAAARGIKGFSSILDTYPGKAPLKRNTDPEEVADTAVFLASDLGRGVTGNILFVDAGFQVMGL